MMAKTGQTGVGKTREARCTMKMSALLRLRSPPANPIKEQRYTCRNKSECTGAIV
jgi:hypothetical protein